MKNEQEQEQKSIIEQIEDIKAEICDKYCKYPTMEPPQGKSQDEWLFEDDGPCANCVLGRL